MRLTIMALVRYWKMINVRMFRWFLRKFGYLGVSFYASSISLLSAIVFVSAVVPLTLGKHEGAIWLLNRIVLFVIACLTWLSNWYFTYCKVARRVNTKQLKKSLRRK